MTRLGIAAAGAAVTLAASVTGCANTKDVEEGFGLQPGKAFDLSRVGGKVVVAPTGRAEFDLGERSRVPAGARVDTRRGAVRITAARPGGDPETARVSGGVFTLRSAAAGARTRIEPDTAGGRRTLRLSGPPSFTVG